MSRVRKYTRYDNDPNSIFGASRQVLNDYKKALAKETEGKPIKQGVKTEEGSKVVKDLNEFNGMIKGITNSLNQSEIYLQTEFKSNLSGSGRKPYQKMRGGGNPKDIQAKASDFEGTPDEKRRQFQQYFDDKYKTVGKSGLVQQADINLMNKLGIQLASRSQNKGSVSEYVKKAVEPEHKLPYQRKAEAKASAQASALGDDLVDEAEEEAEREDDVNEQLNAEVEDEGRFTENPSIPAVLGGQPDPNEYNDYFESMMGRQYDEDEYMNAPLPDSEEEEEAEEGDEYEEDSEEEDSEAEEEESEEETEGEPIEEYDNEETEPVTIEDINRFSKGSVEVQEKYLVTLLSNINNKVQIATDFWEQNISPNLSVIPKIKMDSFVKGKVISDFEEAIAEIENDTTKDTIHYHFDFLDKIYNKLISSLDELFNTLNADIKKYSSGMFITGGYLPVKSPYNPFLSGSKTKYLM